MAIVGAAAVPHSPLLLPSIAKSHLDRSAQIRTALVDVGQELYAAKPDIVVIMTPHAPMVAGAFSVELGDQLQGHLRDFGDLQTTLQLPGATAIAHRLKEASQIAGVALQLQSRSGLDYGVIVPWLTLWGEIGRWPIIPIGIGPLPIEDVLRCGTLLQDYFHSRPERIIIIASGDTDRRPGKMTAADRRPTAAERLVSEAIVTVNVSRLAELKEPRMCLADPVTLLLASVQGLATHGTIRAFEVPLVVGQLVATLTIHH